MQSAGEICVHTAEVIIQASYVYNIVMHVVSYITSSHIFAFTAGQYEVHLPVLLC